MCHTAYLNYACTTPAADHSSAPKPCICATHTQPCTTPGICNNRTISVAAVSQLCPTHLAERNGCSEARPDVRLAQGDVKRMREQEERGKLHWKIRCALDKWQREQNGAGAAVNGERNYRAEWDLYAETGGDEAAALEKNGTEVGLPFHIVESVPYASTGAEEIAELEIRGRVGEGAGDHGKEEAMPAWWDGKGAESKGEGHGMPAWWAN